MTTPNWSYWKDRRAAELWEAVALACDIEPRKENGERRDYWQGLAAGRPYRDRLEIAMDHSRLPEESVIMGCIGLAPFGDDGSLVYEKINVKTATFASWVRGMKWDAPAGFKSLEVPNDPAILNAAGFLDPDAESYPELLAIAYRAWYAASAGEVPASVGTAKQRIRRFLDDNYPETTYPRMTIAAKEAITLICNWDPKGGRPTKAQ